ncbi:hypothetical protein EHS13_17630 [Paenibacillus psychroresistens]|uniref:Uncharacterized protein n=1 Tax=Paenibacillus psychroresistens TaxID=1778678 RepID=A0A6B8RLQ1_9BACL|nr:hypothetical protein [Paenibacillus psychroresistens]QGQ96572.1 hypothetical protein EHS13_17630 [Paenibacillus psychroresistens]
MEVAHQTLIKRAYAIPILRQIIINKGTIYLYCDFSGHDDVKYCGLACCLVYNRAINVTAKKISFEHLGDSIYGELLAIFYSLDILGEVLNEYLPKFAVLYTDCSCITRLLLKNHTSKPLYQAIRNQITESLDNLKIRFPEVDVTVKYISKHKKNNPLHKMAHIAARKAIGK